MEDLLKEWKLEEYLEIFEGTYIYHDADVVVNTAAQLIDNLLVVVVDLVFPSTRTPHGFNLVMTVATCLRNGTRNHKRN